MCTKENPAISEIWMFSHSNRLYDQYSTHTKLTEEFRFFSFTSHSHSLQFLVCGCLLAVLHNDIHTHTVSQSGKRNEKIIHTERICY